MFDNTNWAAGIAAQKAGEIFQTYGDIYVDTKRKCAFGVNGVTVTRVESDLAGLAVYGKETFGKARTITVKTDTGLSFKTKIKKNADFEFQV